MSTTRPEFIGQCQECGEQNADLNEYTNDNGTHFLCEGCRDDYLDADRAGYGW